MSLFPGVRTASTLLTIGILIFSGANSLAAKFKKTYFEAKYSVEEYEKKVSEWEGLIQKLLMRRR